MYEVERKVGSRNPAFDWMKLLLSVFVMAIHAEVEMGYLTPVLWASVPLFFMTSGYFFFGKLSAADGRAARYGMYRKFLKRNLVLYGFWFVVLLPVTVYIRGWYSGSVLENALDLVQSFLFNSTFRASWYLMALNIGVGLILLVSNRISTPVLLLLTLPVHLLCCLFSNYYGLIADNAAVLRVYEGYLAVFRSLNNGFPAGLFWIALGKYLAEREAAPDGRRMLILAGLSAVLLMAEHGLVEYFRLAKTHNAYLALIPFCAAVFSWVRTLKGPLPGGERLGQASTIVYALHASVISLAGAAARRLLPVRREALQWVIFAVTALVCAAACLGIFLLEKRKGFRWLRCCH